MNKKIWIAVLVIVLAAVVVAVFLSTKEREPQAIRIGAILSLSGSGAEFGKDELVGAQIAIEEAKLGTPALPLELVVEDSKSQAKDAVSAYQKLLSSRPRPVAILTVLSSVSLALVPLAERDMIPIFCVGAAPALTKGNRYVFRSLPTSDYQARMLLELSKAKLDYNSVSILYIIDEFGSSMESEFRKVAERIGVTVLSSEGIRGDAGDYRPSLIKLLDPKPDAVYVAAFGSLLGNVVRQIRELGYTGTILTTLEMGYPKVLDVAGKAAEGAVFVDTRFDALSSDSATVKFVQAFMRKADRQPSLDAVLAYDEIQMIFEAGSREGFTPEGIRKGLMETRNFKSLNGNASMLPNGDVAYELVLKAIRNGQPEVLKGD